jgi:hypothetical protein
MDYLSEHILAARWRADNEITDDIVVAALGHGLPPPPVVETVLRIEGIAWVNLARLYGVLPTIKGATSVTAAVA